MNQYSEFQRFLFYFGRFEITFNPKYDTPVFGCHPNHLGLYQMFEDFVKQIHKKNVYIDPKNKFLFCDDYRVEYQGVVMY